MPDQAQCFECRAIVEEIRAAAATGKFPRPEATAEVRANTRKIMAATADEIDELLARFPFRLQKPALHKLAADRYPAMVPLLRKMVAHRLRTGHNVIDLLRK